MDTLLQDFRHAFRGFARNPGFAAAAILTLALGIGANTAIFSVVNAVLISPLPFHEPGRLVRIWGTYAPMSLVNANVNPLDALDWAKETRALSGVSLWQQREGAWTGVGEPSVISEARVSAGFFPLLGVAPALGRGFVEGEDQPGRDAVCVISQAFWRGRLGADPAVLGRTLTIRGLPLTVVGVLPPGFRRPVIAGTAEPEIYQPLAYDPAKVRGGHFLAAVGRLAPGVDLASAESALKTVSAALAQAQPETNKGWGVKIEKLGASLRGDRPRTLLILLGAVGLVLLIACVNVAALLLARGVSRRREAAIRVSLGASRGRLIRQLLAESILLSLFGAALGILAGEAGTKALSTLVSDPGLRLSAAHLDGTVLAFSLFLGIAAGVLAGFLPALQHASVDPLPALKGERAGGALRRRFPVGDILVSLEVALALALLVGAGLLTKSLWLLYRVDPGFSPVHVLTFDLSLPATRYPKPLEQRLFFRNLMAGLASIPGVTQAGGVNIAPLSGGYSCDGFALEDRPAPPAGEEPCAESRTATPDYFNAMKIPLRAGRLLSARDDANAPKVVVVSETMARKWWPGSDAIGKRFKWGTRNDAGTWQTVVGVVGDIRHKGLDAPADPEVYTPLDQFSESGLSIMLRTANDPRSALTAAHAEVKRLDPLLPLQRARTFQEQLDASIASPRLRSLLLGLFAALGLVLSAVGLFGVVSQTVRERTREFGIRLALGAEGRQVVGLVVAHGARLVAAGLAAGLLVALLASRILKSVLFGMTAIDPLVFAGVALVLTAVALTACALPALRAAHVQPSTVLRDE